MSVFQTVMCKVRGRHKGPLTDLCVCGRFVCGPISAHDVS